ncbi:spindle pole body formation-associated protein-domain-containing protein [Aspergillus crustosus]
MMGWMGGQNDQAPVDSRIMEPPETPAPMFALRAFQSALFGTPKADDEDNTNAHLTSKEESHNTQQANISALPRPIDQKGDRTRTTAADFDLAMNASPTKSILMTPGTISNRRKTVSFGEGVVDNERQRDDVSSRIPKTPVALSGNISSQWTSGSSEGKRSRLTQTLMDSREKPSRSDNFSQKPSEGRSSKSEPKAPLAPAQEDANEDTVNMDEPRSRSGKYWKAEFDSYRTKTALEIKRLIQYRSAAKTFAKKKDDEAIRLATKLKEEELRVEEMERHVTQLASTMVAENTRADKEQLVQNLTKQTALALQYKHKVSLLRKVLEQHGVVGSEVDDIAEQSASKIVHTEASEALRKAQQALAQANSRIEYMEQQQSDFEKLKGLALSSEQKASELEKENVMLKNTLARFKQEASKYEGRRKEREARLKEREAKLETRIQEYRERLKSTTQQHRDQEEDLKLAFDDERHRMQDQIDVLKTKLRAFETATEIRTRARPESRRGDDRIHVQDFGHTSPRKETFDDTMETDQPPSPSPRGKPRRLHGIENDLKDMELRKAMKELGIDDIDEKFNNIGISPLRTFKPPRYQEDTNHIPPSSPPEMPTPNTGTWTGTNLRRNAQDNRLSHQTTASLPNRRLQLDDSHQIRPDRLRSRRSATKYSLDALSSLPDTYHLDRTKRRQTTTVTPRDPLLLERKMAVQAQAQAQARLKRKDEPRKSKEDGKENHIRTAVKT